MNSLARGSFAANGKFYWDENTSTHRLSHQDILRLAGGFERRMVAHALQCAKDLTASGVDCPVTDPRSFLRNDRRGRAFMGGFFEAYFMIAGDPPVVDRMSELSIHKWLIGRIGVTASKPERDRKAREMIHDMQKLELAKYTLQGVRAGHAYLLDLMDDDDKPFRSLFDVLPNDGE